MLSPITRKIAVGATFIALVTPAFAKTPMGTDPEPDPPPKIVHVILAFLGLA